MIRCTPIALLCCHAVHQFVTSNLTNHRSVIEVFVAIETVVAVAQLGTAGSSLLKTSWPMSIAVMSLDVS